MYLQIVSGMRNSTGISRHAYRNAHGERGQSRSAKLEKIYRIAGRDLSALLTHMLVNVARHRRLQFRWLQA